MPVVVEYSNHSVESDKSENDTSFLSFEKWNWRELKRFFPSIFPFFSSLPFSLVFLLNFSLVIHFSRLFCDVRSELFMLKAAAIVGGGGFIYGYDIGIISGTLLQLENRFSLSVVEQGLVVSLLPVGSIFGCIFGGPLCDYIGRWQTIIIQNLIYIGNNSSHFTLSFFLLN